MEPPSSLCVLLRAWSEHDQFRARLLVSSVAPGPSGEAGAAVELVESEAGLVFTSEAALLDALADMLRELRDVTG